MLIETILNKMTIVSTLSINIFFKNLNSFQCFYLHENNG